MVDNYGLNITLNVVLHMSHVTDIRFGRDLPPKPTQLETGIEIQFEFKIRCHLGM